MFSLPSFPKLFLVVAVIAIVWWWFRRPAVQSDRSESRVRNDRAGAAPRAGAAKQKAVEDLVKCPSCGTYIAAGSPCDCKNGK